ncbi:MAG: hypothetical protein FWC80_04665 [Firmicutes bacterium]|nr:hypothetical protein [Bacillota bacterium]
MIKKLVLRIGVIVVFIAGIVFPIQACYIGNNLADGVYVPYRIYIDGEEIVKECDFEWATLQSMFGQLMIEGNRMMFVTPLREYPISAQTRIRSGYIEQRSPDFNNNRWGRENGSSASNWVSTRAERGQIVIRLGEKSEMGQIFGGRVYVFYSNEVELPPATLEFRINGETVITGNYVASAYATIGMSGDPVVVIRFCEVGAEKLRIVSAENIGQRMEVVIIMNYEERIVSTPMINTMITGGRAVVTAVRGGSKSVIQLSGQINMGIANPVFSQGNAD